MKKVDVLVIQTVGQMVGATCPSRTPLCSIAAWLYHLKPLFSGGKDIFLCRANFTPGNMDFIVYFSWTHH